MFVGIAVFRSFGIGGGVLASSPSIPSFDGVSFAGGSGGLFSAVVLLHPMDKTILSQKHFMPRICEPRAIHICMVFRWTSRTFARGLARSHERALASPPLVKLAMSARGAQIKNKSGVHRATMARARMPVARVPSRRT